MRALRIAASCGAFLASLAAGAPAPAGAGTAFTYQGELRESGEAADGAFAMEFSLWDAARGGAQIGGSIVLNDVAVVDGRFTVDLPFGADAYNGDLWLEIIVDGTPLTPRQRIAPAPLAVNIVDVNRSADGRFAIGNSVPEARLDVRIDDADAILGISSFFNGVVGFTANNNKAGVYGFTNAAAGWGVYGESTNLTGIDTRGVYGRSARGAGVYGEATGITGTNYGVFGSTASPDGYGGYFLGRGYFSDYVGIGTTTPATPLHIVGTDPIMQQIRSSSTVGTWLDLHNTSSAFAKRWGFVSTGVDNGEGAGKLLLRSISDGQTIMTLEGDTGGFPGRVGIGTTDPGGPLHVEGDSLVLYTIYASNASAGTGVAAILGRNSYVSGRGVVGEAISPSGTNYGVWGESSSTSGYDFYAGGAGMNYGASSSIRWKRNIESIENPLKMLTQLRGVYFDWDAEHGGHHDIGMIAEEVGMVLPEIVNYEENGIDASGMDYSKLTPLLVEAVNELRRENEELKDRLAALEAAVGRSAAYGQGAAP